MTEFVYKPPNGNLTPQAMNGTVAFKFSQATFILDPWYIVGGTKWTRFVFRMKHPWVYSKRGLKKLYRKIRRIFVKDRIIKCSIR